MEQKAIIGKRKEPGFSLCGKVRRETLKKATKCFAG